MPLYIRDDDVRARAERLARRRGCSLTEAVRLALGEAEARDASEAEEKRRRACALLAGFDAAPRLRPGFTDADLYDADGSPAL